MRSGVNGRATWSAVVALLAGLTAAAGTRVANAQDAPQVGAIVGRVTDSVSGQRIAVATVVVEGTGLSARSRDDGGYRIVRVGGGFSFQTDDGHVIGRRLLAPVDLQMTLDPESPRAEWGGEDMDFDHMTFVLEQHFPPTDARARPPN